MIGLFANTLFAQTYDADALRYNQEDLGTTARAVGAGGAFSTVGADLSNITNNPAGIGLYRSTEISLSFSPRFGKSTTEYLGQSSSSSFSKFNMPNAGIAIAVDQAKKKKNKFSSNSHRFINVAIGYNRVANFNQSSSFSGKNYDNSFVYAIANDINSNTDPINYNYFSPQVVLAYQTYLVDPDTATGAYFSYVNAPVKQTGTITTKGGMDEVNIAVAGNVKDNFYWGVTLGVPWLSYTRQYTYSEEPLVVDTFNYFRKYTLNNSYTINGYGINAKLGFIYKPVSWLRLGASVKTPSLLTLDDVQHASMESSIFNTTFSANTDTVNLVSRYSFTTPWRGLFGACFILPKVGFLSVDYELSDYRTKINFKDYPATTTSVNELIKQKYTLSHQVKAGAEFAIKSFRLRGGFAWQSTPFAANIIEKKYNSTTFSYTGGLGYRGKWFFADLAYVYQTTSSYLAPYYFASNEPGAKTKYATHIIQATVGVKFGKK